ncbi:MAG TPA: CHAD domain-containing protein [Methanoregula sp.]|nr:CHAD domain-containing protein [Methanoregula sp.]
MTSVEEPGQVPAVCIFGVQRILPLLEAFLGEIEGVRAAKDIEHIHRMRVASRRLRAALPLFKSCFPKKKFRVWMRELQKITRALGDARDADVQIAFLVRLQEKKVRQKGENPPDVSRVAVDPVDVETILLTRLKKKRQKLQGTVLSALENLEGSSIPEDMSAACNEIIARAGNARTKPTLYGIPPISAARISDRLFTLMEYERHVYNPDAVAEHHAMRIAAKKLRYTMEVYAPLYRRNLKKPLIRVKKIQEILGDLHDCDIWIDTVMAMLLTERSSPGNDPSPGMEGRRVTSYRHFLSDREKERTRIYRRLVRYWESVGSAHIWDELRITLSGGIKKRFGLSEIPHPDAVRASVSGLSSSFPEGMQHSRTVTALALQIFDDLAALHQMQAQERFILECACLLHDIGWKYGRKGHGRRSMDMIVSDDTLPVGITDRGMIGLISAAHRGNVRLDSHGFFSLLSPEQRKHVLMLSSLIRIADGLDYLHSGSVTSVHCSAGSDKVVIETSVQRDASAEIERALQKGDLFTQIFERTLVIR